MGLEIREIKKDEVKVKIKVKKGDEYIEEERYSDLWKQVVTIMDKCLVSSKSTDQDILEDCGEYATEFGIESHGGMSSWWAALDGKKVVGMALIYTNGKKYCYADSIAVHPDEQSKGYGKKIIEFLKDRYIKIKLSSYKSARSFYKTCGFKEEDFLDKKNNERFKITPPKDDNDMLKHNKLQKLNKTKTSKDDTNHPRLKKLDKEKREWKKKLPKFFI